MIYQTRSGEEFQIDDVDVGILEKYPRIYRNSDGYIVVQSTGRRNERRYLLHRLTMDCPPHLVVDHINHDKADNRRQNLRICTRNENNLNRIKSEKPDFHTSQYKGVKWHKEDQKWHAQIQVNKKYVWLGMYETEIEAAERYDDAARHFFKEYALVNFPQRHTKPYVAKTPHKRHSEFKGISFDKTRKTRPWSACIQLNGKRWQARFNTEEEAISAWQKVQQDISEGKPLPETQGRAKPKYSQHPGITFDIRKVSKPWKAKIKVKGVILWQGNFLTEAEAIQALQEKRPLYPHDISPISY